MRIRKYTQACNELLMFVAAFASIAICKVGGDHTIVEPSIIKICSEEMRCIEYGFTGRLQQFFGWESLKYILRICNRSCLDNYALFALGSS